MEWIRSMMRRLLSALQKFISGESLPSLAIAFAVGLGVLFGYWGHREFQEHCREPKGKILCKEKDSFPWSTLRGVVAAPCILLTWYWRTVHKWRDIENAKRANNTSFESLGSTRFKDSIALLDGDSMAVFAGIHGLKVETIIAKGAGAIMARASDPAMARALPLSGVRRR